MGEWANGRMTGGDVISGSPIRRLALHPFTLSPLRLWRLFAPKFTRGIRIGLHLIHPE